MLHFTFKIKLNSMPFTIRTVESVKIDVLLDVPLMSYASNGVDALLIIALLF